MALPLPSVPPDTCIKRELSSSNNYESIPYENYDKLAVADTYNTLSHLGVGGGAEGRGQKRMRAGEGERRGGRVGSVADQKRGSRAGEEPRAILEDGVEGEEEGSERNS